MPAGSISTATPCTAALPLIQGNVVKAIANLSRAAHAMLPELADRTGARLAGVAVYGWNAFFFPQSDARADRAPLNAAAAKMLEMPSVREQWRKLGLEVPAPETRSPEYLAGHVAREIETWAGPIRASGVSLD